MENSLTPNNITLILLTAQTLLLLTAGILLFRKNKQIKTLKEKIIEEQHKRIVPVLGFSPDRGTPSLRIRNEGTCLVKNLQIADIETVVDVGFQKRLTFRFAPIALLQPGESQTLIMEIFEKDCALPHSVVEKMGGILLSSSFLAEIRCENTEGIPFWLRLKKDGLNSTIEKITILDESQ